MEKDTLNISLIFSLNVGYLRKLFFDVKMKK